MVRRQVAVLFAVALAISAVQCRNVADSNGSSVGGQASNSNQELFRSFLKAPVTNDVSPRILIKHDLGKRVNGK